MKGFEMLPLVLAVGCAEDGTLARWKDKSLETFNVEVISSGDEVKGVSYDVLKLITGDLITEDDTDGHENFTLPVILDESVDGWDFNKDEREVRVTSEWWCDTALTWMNIYTQILESGSCVQDLSICEEQSCNKEELQVVLDGALNTEE